MNKEEIAEGTCGVPVCDHDAPLVTCGTQLAPPEETWCERASRSALPPARHPVLPPAGAPGARAVQVLRPRPLLPDHVFGDSPQHCEAALCACPHLHGACPEGKDCVHGVFHTCRCLV